MFRLNLSIRDNCDRAFLILFAVDIVLRVVWLGNPANRLIFDEEFYVGAARVILGFGGVRGEPVAYGLDPNPYHPPLAKLLIALSMFLIGDNGFAWRFPSAIFGSAAVVLFYLLLKKLANRKTALIGTFLFSFDSLVYFMSRVAMLDIFTLTFMLLGFYWYFSDHPRFSAIGMALSTLTKITGASGLIVVVTVEVVRFLQNQSARRAWRSLIGWIAKYVATYGAFFLATLAVLDYFWVGIENFFVPFAFAYGQSAGSNELTFAGTHVFCPVGIIVSCPWQWLINEVPIPVNLFAFKLTFAMNPAILFFAIPAIVYSAYRYQRGSLFGLFNIAWFLVTYLPYYPLAFGNAATYIYYFLLTVPSICSAIAYAIVEKRIPRALIIVYFGAILLFFYLAIFRTIPYYWRLPTLI